MDIYCKVKKLRLLKVTELTKKDMFVGLLRLKGEADHLAYLIDINYRKTYARNSVELNL